MNLFHLLSCVPFCLSMLAWSSPASAAPGDRGHIAYAGARSYYEARVNLAEPERERIRKHLAVVEADLRAHPPAGLTAAQMSKRLALLDTLKIYREQGVFPRNLDFPDRLVPYFIDAAGVPCAMAKLVIASGHGDYAEEIRATMNNAYIGEIAAVDARLAAWGVEHGITLEEAARVQPAYGPPSLAHVMNIATDSRGRLWVTGPVENVLGGYGVGVRDAGQWSLARTGFGSGATYGFCLAGGGEALVAMDGYVLTWPRATNDPVEPSSRFYAYGLSSCTWQEGDSLAWAGGSRGLLLLERSSGDSVAIRDSFPPPPGVSDTVTALAAASGRVWVGTANGLYARTLSGPDTHMTWDAGVLGGTVVTGLKSEGKSVWLGLDGGRFGSGVGRFSTKGLRRIVGDSVKAFRASLSSVMVPGDTIHALAVRDSASVWLATSRGFYHFSGTASAPKVADLPAPGLMVNDMTGDTTGFYAATPQGVYEYRNGNLTFIGSPTVGLKAGNALFSRDRAGIRLHAQEIGTQAGTPGAHTILGRRTGTTQAAGVYVSPSSSSSSAR